MRTLILIFLITVLSLSAFGGEIFVVKTKADADVVVYVTQWAWDADLWVTPTDVSMYAQHNDHYWKFVNYKLPSVIKVYFTNTQKDADVIISYSENRGGWKKANKFQGRLH